MGAPLTWVEYRQPFSWVCLLAWLPGHCISATIVLVCPWFSSSSLHVSLRILCILFRPAFDLNEIALDLTWLQVLISVTFSLLQCLFISSFLFIGLAFRTLWSASVLPIPSVWHHVFFPQCNTYRSQTIPKPTVVHVLFMRYPFPTLTVLFLTIDCSTSSWSLPFYTFKQPCSPGFCGFSVAHTRIHLALQTWREWDHTQVTFVLFTNALDPVVS